MSQTLHSLVAAKALNYHHLNYFRVIAIAGGIAAASKVLRISQSALSTQLRSFEAFFGHELFYRRNRTMMLTDFGKIILGYANEIFRLGSEMIEVANDGITMSRPHVHIGVAHGVPKRQAIGLVRKAFDAGECSLTITEDNADSLMRELLEHRVDLVLSSSAARPAGPSHVYSLLLERARVVFCGAKSLKLPKEALPYALHKKPLILPSIRQRLRHELDLYFKASQVQVNIVAETDDTALQKGMAQAGMGIIAVPEPAVRHFISRGTLLNFGYADHIYSESWLHAASRRVENPVASKIMRRALQDSEV